MKGGAGGDGGLGGGFGGLGGGGGNGGEGACGGDGENGGNIITPFVIVTVPLFMIAVVWTMHDPSSIMEAESKLFACGFMHPYFG